MNRRNFLRNTSGLTLPFLGGVSGIRAASSSSLSRLLAGLETDRVLVLIQLGGGNDGLNTLVPLDQLSNLNKLRPNVVLPERSLLPLQPAAAQGLHPRMGGFQKLFGEGKLGVVQSVGYPNQNRSHFRSTDIWSTASPSEVEYTTGWVGRYMEGEFPDYPENYPRPGAPHPPAITMGNAASETCQGTVTNVCQTINDPFRITYLAPGGDTPLPNTAYGDEVEYLRIAISQTNEYGTAINAAVEAGHVGAAYPDGRFANHLRNIASMIAGGLETKVYVVQLGGFDTHARQVDTNKTEGRHADLLGELSDGITAFQRDIDGRGLTDRVLGLTYSEFGRQIASNGSDGTDHGDAAPLFVFGGCSNGSVLGDNPTIAEEVDRGTAVPFQQDFRNVYGSILVDWFDVPTERVKRLIFADFQYLPVAAGCSSAVGLPVDFLGFAAREEETRIVLAWQTAQERDNKGFEIERSENGSEFDYVGWQAGAGETAVGADYTYTDISVENNKRYYYRLRQIDHDGTFAHSNIVTARLSTAAAGSLTVGLPYPNPVIDQTTVKIYAPTDARVTYSVHDLSGRQLLTDSQSLVGRRDNSVRVRTGRLPAGTYALRFRVGDKQESRSIIVR